MPLQPLLYLNDIGDLLALRAKITSPTRKVDSAIFVLQSGASHPMSSKFKRSISDIFLATTLISYNQRILCLGAISRKVTPVPIPNTVVKLPWADGSAIARE